MSSGVNGNINDYYYCYRPGEEGWYKVVGDHQSVRVDESEVPPDDIQDPPRLKNYQEFNFIPDSSNGGGYGGKGTKYNDLESYVGEHTGTGPGGYFTEDDLQAIANGNFNGDTNIPTYVRDQANALLKGGKFDKLAGDDHLFHRWNFDEMNSKPAPLPERSSSAPDLATLLKDNGNYAKRADIELIANTGTYKGMKVPQSVQDEAKALMADNGKLFNERAGDDGVLANWDLNGSVSSSQPPSSAPPSSAPPSSAPPSSAPPSSAPASSAPASSVPNSTIDAARLMIKLYPGDNPTNDFIKDIKTKAGILENEYITKPNLREVIAKETDPEKKALFQWALDNFDNMDDTAGGTASTHDNDDQIGAGDVQHYLGWNGEKPGYNPDPTIQSPKPQNPNSVQVSDIMAIYGRDNTAQALIDDLKSRAGVTGQWLARGDIARVLATTTDEGKKAVFQWLYDNFENIDNTAGGTAGTHDNDHLIGPDDVEEYWGWR